MLSTEWKKLSLVITISQQLKISRKKSDVYTIMERKMNQKKINFYET